jgi:uncharacterized phage protein gp47/JayE
VAVDLPGEIVVFDRDQIVAQYLRSYKLRVPEADVGPGTAPYIDAHIHADQMMVVYQDARVIGNGTNLDTSRGTRLEQIGAAEDVPRPEASPSTGYVDITTSTGGATILQNDELLDEQSGLRFYCMTTALYTSDKPAPIAAVDTGPSTNLAAGTILKWSNPRPGCSRYATVRETSDGEGLTGGRDQATDEEWIEIIKENRANPPASGNDATYRKAVRKTPGLQVEQVFTYPAMGGPGTTAIAFTLKPATPGGSRIPNAAQIALVEANLKAEFPGDDGIFVLSIIGQSVEIAIEVEWRRGAAAWSDVTPWPAWVTSDPVRVKSGVTPTATTFRVGTTSTDTTTPQVGQTIGLYDADEGIFRLKRIGAISVVVANRSWDLTIDTSEAVSDTSLIPTIGDLVSPWSDSLDALAEPIIAAMDGIGPGEQVATFYDPGIRQRRQPQSPAEWPSILTNKVLMDDVFDLIQVGDAGLLLPASTPYETTVGTLLVSVNILELGGFAVFPK